MNKTVILFDIDYTLFNTDKFRDVTYPKLTHILGQEDTPAYHKQVSLIEKDLISYGGYEPVLFVRNLAKVLKVQPVYEEVNSLFYDDNLYDECLYGETKHVLQELSKRENITLGIVSKGENSFQRRKIAPIMTYFKDENIYISLSKTDKIDEIYNHYADQKIIIVDDSAIFLSEVNKRFPVIETILVERENRYERKEAPANFQPDKRITTLGEVL